MSKSLDERRWHEMSRGDHEAFVKNAISNARSEEELLSALEEKVRRFRCEVISWTEASPDEVVEAKKAGGLISGSNAIVRMNIGKQHFSCCQKDSSLKKGRFKKN